MTTAVPPLPGVKIIFRVGLVLLKCMLGSQEKLKKSQGLYETMELLKALQPAYVEEGFLVREVRERVLSTTLDTRTLSTSFHRPVMLLLML